MCSFPSGCAPGPCPERGCGQRPVAGTPTGDGNTARPPPSRCYQRTSGPDYRARPPASSRPPIVPVHGLGEAQGDPGSRHLHGAVDQPGELLALLGREVVEDVSHHPLLGVATLWLADAEPE